MERQGGGACSIGGVSGRGKLYASGGNRGNVQKLILKIILVQFIKFSNRNRRKEHYSGQIRNNTFSKNFKSKFLSNQKQFWKKIGVERQGGGACSIGGVSGRGELWGSGGNRGNV